MLGQIPVLVELTLAINVCRYCLGGVGVLRWPVAGRSDFAINYMEYHISAGLTQKKTSQK